MVQYYLKVNCKLSVYTINPRASIFLKRKTKRFSYQENRGDKLEYQNILD